MAVYYNEFDPKAAAWLRELIRAKQIPEGEVDERSIEEVQPADVAGFRQCHFFAGIAGWSLALRLAGVSSETELWTGSCPCQPFSAAGKQRGQSDKRHLWPAWFNLIKVCRPERIFGEQVSSAIRLGWLDGICADMETEGYAVGSIVLGAHSAGAPHIRQRLYWMAIAAGRQIDASNTRGLHAESGLRGHANTDRLPDASERGCGIERGEDRAGGSGHADGSGEAGAERLAESEDANGGGGNSKRAERGAGGPDLQEVAGMAKPGLELPRGGVCRSDESFETHEGRTSIESGGSGGNIGERMGSPIRSGLEGHTGDVADGNEPGRVAPGSNGPTAAAGSPGSAWISRGGDGVGQPHGGFWDAYYIIHFIDGKTRRIEPGTQPLVNGVSARVVRLRGYGNAIVPPLAAAFIKACLEAEAIANPTPF